MKLKAIVLIAIAALNIANAATFVTSIKLDFLNPSQQPSTEEFLLAAKRTFHARRMEFEVVNERTVRGTYAGSIGHDGITYEIRRRDSGVEILFVGGISRDYKNAGVIDRHLNNLKLDIVYELGRYLL